MNIRFLRLSTVLNQTGRSKTDMYRRINQGLFPKPIRLSVRQVAWVEEEIHLTMRAALEGWDDDKLRAKLLALREAILNGEQQ